MHESTAWCRSAAPIYDAFNLDMLLVGVFRCSS